MNKIFGEEPVAVYAAINAAIGLLVTFGLHLSPDQIGAILVFTNTILALATRQAVVPNATHEAQVTAALYAPKPTVPDLTTSATARAEAPTVVEQPPVASTEVANAAQ